MSNAIPMATRAMADVIKGKTVINGDTGTDGDSFESTIDDKGFTMEHVAAFQSHRDEFVNAVRLGAGEASVDHLVKNPDVQAVTVRSRIGRDEVIVQTRREFKHRERPADPNSPMVTVRGQTTAGYNSSGPSTKDAHAVRDSVRDYANAAFADLK